MTGAPRLQREIPLLARRRALPNPCLADAGHEETFRQLVQALRYEGSGAATGQDAPHCMKTYL